MVSPERVASSSTNATKSIAVMSARAEHDSHKRPRDPGRAPVRKRPCSNEARRVADPALPGRTYPLRQPAAASPGELRQRHLPFVRRGGILLQRGIATCRVPAALLGRFLPRLGPLAPASGPFFCAAAICARAAP